MIDNVDYSYKLKNGLTDKDLVKKLSDHNKNEQQLINKQNKNKNDEDHEDDHEKINKNYSSSSNFYKDRINDLKNDSNI